MKELDLPTTTYKIKLKAGDSFFLLVYPDQSLRGAMKETLGDRGIDPDDVESVRADKDVKEAKYETVVKQWIKTADDEAVLLDGIGNQGEVSNIRNLLYRRFGKDKVMVRSAQKEEGGYKVVIRSPKDHEQR
jgi:hypothetical protein